MAGKSPNWIRIKAEYIRGGTSYRKLAAKHGVPESTLTKRAIRESWDAERQQIAIEVAAAVHDDASAAGAADAQAIASQQLADLDAYRQALVGLLPGIRQKGGVLGPEGWIKNYRALQQAQRLVLGLPEYIKQPEGIVNEPGAETNSGDLPAAVLLLPGKSTDWASLATARESGLDAESGGASGVPGVPE